MPAYRDLIRSVINLRRLGIEPARIDSYVAASKAREQAVLSSTSGEESMVHIASTDRRAEQSEVEDAYIEHISAHAFAPTVIALEQAIARAGLTMPPTMVLIYGNPRGGTPIMLATPRAAIDLPLRVLVREGEDGRTFVGFHPIDAELRKAGVAEDHASRLLSLQTIVVEGARS